MDWISNPLNTILDQKSYSLVKPFLSYFQTRYVLPAFLLVNCCASLSAYSTSLSASIMTLESLEFEFRLMTEIYKVVK